MKDKHQTVPVQKNMDLLLSIDSLTAEGMGVGRYNGFTVMVPGSLPGEEVLAHIVKLMKNYAIGKCLKIQKASPMRTEPLCPNYEKCGGCQFMHLSYEAQLQEKRETVLSAVRRIGQFTAEEISDSIIENTRGMEDPIYYRNKAQFPVQLRDGQLIHGFYAPHSHRLIPVSDCLIQSRTANSLAEKITRYADSLGMSAYDEQSGKGMLRHILIRDDEQTEEVSVCLVINQKKLPHQENWIRFAEKEGITSFSVNINQTRSNVILGKETKILYGKPYMTAKIGDLSYHVSPVAFFQVNSRQTKVLYDLVKEMIDPQAEDAVWDIYCGAGTIGLYLAKCVRMIYGVEVVPEAIENAHDNMRLNGITNAEYYVGKAEELVPEKLKSGIRVDKAVIDPPRSGCDRALLDALLAMVPKRIVYVSCDPATLARDLKVLCEAYQIERICPVDMFPHTGHVESVVKLTAEREK
ncbi:MAG: 23S rRNA (uracil(1939)-C(5))-methyltransferase RlmD [Firmicutes bacterium]|nr:23S rRNA (uracil(1939)-C(5))-methyltransferase RlmD [Bacillota bacterium]